MSSLPDERISPPSSIEEMTPAEIQERDMIRDVNVGTLIDEQAARHMIGRNIGSHEHTDSAMAGCPDPACQAAARLMEMGLVGVEGD